MCQSPRRSRYGAAASPARTTRRLSSPPSRSCAWSATAFQNAASSASAASRTPRRRRRDRRRDPRMHPVPPLRPAVPREPGAARRGRPQVRPRRGRRPRAPRAAARAGGSPGRSEPPPQVRPGRLDHVRAAGRRPPGRPRTRPAAGPPEAGPPGRWSSSRSGRLGTGPGPGCWRRRGRTPPACPGRGLLGGRELGVQPGPVGGGGVGQLQQLGMALHHPQHPADPVPVRSPRRPRARTGPASACSSAQVRQLAGQGRGLGAATARGPAASAPSAPSPAGRSGWSGSPGTRRRARSARISGPHRGSRQAPSGVSSVSRLSSTSSTPLSSRPAQPRQERLQRGDRADVAGHREPVVAELDLQRGGEVGQAPAHSSSRVGACQNAAAANASWCR